MFVEIDGGFGGLFCVVKFDGGIRSLVGDNTAFAEFYFLRQAVLNGGCWIAGRIGSVINFFWLGDKCHACFT